MHRALKAHTSTKEAQGAGGSFALKRLSCLLTNSFSNAGFACSLSTTSSPVPQKTPPPSSYPRDTAPPAWGSKQ